MEEDNYSAEEEHLSTLAFYIEKIADSLEEIVVENNNDWVAPQIEKLTKSLCETGDNLYRVLAVANWLKVLEITGKGEIPKKLEEAIIADINHAVGRQ